MDQKKVHHGGTKVMKRNREKIREREREFLLYIFSCMKSTLAVPIYQKMFLPHEGFSFALCSWNPFVLMFIFNHDLYFRFALEKMIDI